MTTYFEIKNNVKHNGDFYQKGSVIGGELDEFQGLVNDGLFEVVDGATSLEEATELVAENKVLDETPEEVAEESNTWGPQPDEEEPVEETPKTDGEEKTEEEPKDEDDKSTSSEEEEESDEPEKDEITGDEL